MVDLDISQKDAVFAVRAPKKFGKANLAVDAGFSPEILEMCREYVKNWPFLLEQGRGMVLCGTTGVGKSYAAAATAHSIWRAWRASETINFSWFSAIYTMQEMLNAHTFGEREKFYSMYNKACTTKLLIVDDLLHVGQYPHAKQLMFSIYEYRDQHTIPIITTFNGEYSPDNQDAIISAFNEPFSRRMTENCQNFIMSV